MYSLLMLLGAAGVYLALCLPAARYPGKTAVALAAVSAATLYTHYLGPVLLGVVGLSLLAPRAGRTRWRWWIDALGAAALAWSPWAAQSLGRVVQRAGPAMGEWVPFHDYLARILAVFTYGLSFDATLTGWAWGLALLLLVTALWWARRDRLLLALLWLALPVLATYGLWLYRPLYNPIINPRFALPAAPAFCLWLALGMTGLAGAATWLSDRLWCRGVPAGGHARRGTCHSEPESFGRRTEAKKLALFGTGSFASLRMTGSDDNRGSRLARITYPLVVGITGLALLFFSARSLEAYYFEPKYARDDYRGLVRYIDSQLRPGDTVILSAPGQGEIFGYYFGNAPRSAYAVRPLPGRLPIDEGQAIAELEAISRAHPRAWVVLWAEEESDPNGVVPGWLASHGSRLEEREFGNVRLELYGLSPVRGAG